jgi:hypothetical protein
VTFKSLVGCSYDANGNTLTDASGRSYTWDFENRLTQVVVPGSGTVSSSTIRWAEGSRRARGWGRRITSIMAFDLSRM